MAPVGVISAIGALLGSTIGAGIFGLPYSVSSAGWLLSLVYFAVLAALMAAAHYFYGRLILARGEGLLTLLRDQGRGWFWAGLIFILGGLLVVLIAYLILGGNFLKLVVPRLGGSGAILIFWIAASLPVFFLEKRWLGAEAWGAALTALIILLVFLHFMPARWGAAVNAANWGSAARPFGVFLFALAGWTAILPMLRAVENDTRRFTRALILGTLGVAVLYFLFVLGIFHSAVLISPDTLSGLINWQPWEKMILAILGLIALWTAYMPVAQECIGLLAEDLGWGRSPAVLSVTFLPLLIVLAGFRNFIQAAGVGGGIFVAMQYLLILFLSRKVLVPQGGEKKLLSAVSAVFVAAIILEAINIFS